MFWRSRFVPQVGFGAVGANAELLESAHGLPRVLSLNQLATAVFQDVGNVGLHLKMNETYEYQSVKGADGCKVVVEVPLLVPPRCRKTGSRLTLFRGWGEAALCSPAQWSWQTLRAEAPDRTTEYLLSN